MRDNTKHNPTRKNQKKIIATKKAGHEKSSYPIYWLLLITGIAALCFSPMLNNTFTNWDDEFYVINNTLLRGPDWIGIFTQPVVSNYHPLTILSLALNYHLTGLNPSSYFIFNLILHLINTILAFYFFWVISGKNKWASLFTSLVFAIHPMHVESVAWISERKDLLYTLFFLLSLIKYWHYLKTRKKLDYGLCMLLFVLSLMSKPAAIILPLMLFLIDYWKGRPLSGSAIVEKIPFLLFSVVFAVITVRIQSHSAIAGLEIYPIWTRLLFPCYGIMIYLIRFFIPYPLSAFHPYPDLDNLGWPFLISPLFILVLLFFLWRQRNNKVTIFSILFFVINLLLVLQIISIGDTIVSERYTYVPYIGLSFLLGSWLGSDQVKPYRSLIWIAAGVMVFAFGILTFQRTGVWKNSDILWTDVIKHYPDKALPHSNRADCLYKMATVPGGQVSEADSLIRRALEDCNSAIGYEPGFANAYQTRGLILLRLGRYQEALPDADMFIKLKPSNYLGYSIRGIAYFWLNQPQKALADFTKCLSINPVDDVTLNYKGSALFNSYQNYKEALADFNKAIKISPQGNYFLNRSRCRYMLGDLTNARADADSAAQLGATVPDEFRKLLNP